MIEVEWADAEQRVVRWQFTWPWTWDEFYAAQQHMDDLIDSVDGIIDTVIFPAQNSRMPPSAISNLRRILRQRHPRLGLVVLVGMNNFVLEIVRFSTQIIPGISKQIHHVRSEDEAFTLITATQQQREAASELP